MGFSKSILIAAFLCAAPGGLMAGECRVCDEIIELNADYAQCFNERFDDHLAQLAASSTGRIRVDLAICLNGAQDGERSGLLTMPSLTGSASPPKSVYILDRTYIECLQKLLETRQEPIDPRAEFDLYEQCKS